jgi:hypothetical protein
MKIRSAGPSAAGVRAIAHAQHAGLLVALDERAALFLSKLSKP